MGLIDGGTHEARAPDWRTGTGKRQTHPILEGIIGRANKWRENVSDPKP